MSTVCPACGVAVVPGYIRCPRCHAGLPLGTGRIKRATADPGGTAVPRRSFPVAAVLVALGVAAAIIVVFGVGGSRSPVEEVAPAPLQPMEATPNAPRRTVAAPVTAAAPIAAPAPAQLQAAAVSDLESTLRRQRLWGRVEITGPRIDVRSGSCADPAMRPLIEGKLGLLQAAGLTKLRCVEQSGAIVFERDF
jgi:hypothetical protein